MQDKYMAMTTNQNEDAGDSKEGIHLLIGVGPCCLPAINTGVDTSLQIFNFIDVEPSNVVLMTKLQAVARGNVI
ncbi:hypothetical protein PM082_022189 [Marasmius tenuissimus]|nr:hypothetical protein PM082_022189 [Marasmius tenuissimus]